MLNNKLTKIIPVIALLTIPLVSALELGEIGSIIDEPWLVFPLLFAVFFAISYAALSKTHALKNNIGAALAVSLAISFLATAGLFREDFAAGFSVIKILIIAAIISVGAFLIVTFGRMAYASLGLAGVLIISGIFISAFNWLPEVTQNISAIPDWMLSLSDISIYLGIPLIIIGIIVLFAARGHYD